MHMIYAEFIPAHCCHLNFYLVLVAEPEFQEPPASKQTPGPVIIEITHLFWKEKNEGGKKTQKNLMSAGLALLVNSETVDECD